MPAAAGGASAGDARPYLGISAKSLHSVKKQGLSTHEKTRWRLLRKAQSILYRRDESPDRQHRTCWCCRTAVGESVGLHRQADGGGARFSGVGTCGSVWACPVCSAKVTEARRRELVENMARAGSMGYSAYLLTLTFPHGRMDSLADLLDRQAKALQRFKNSVTYKQTMGAVERLGSVRSLEVTYGDENGWHPHTHDLVFCMGNLATHLDDLKAAWFKALRKVGLVTDAQVNEVLEHGLDVRGGAYAAEYVAKFGREVAGEGWGLSGEVTKSHAKLGMRAGRLSPFQLLQFAEQGDGKAAALFAEFAQCFEGKRMLSYSPKLKKALGVAELSDEALAAMDSPLPDEQNAGRLTLDQYSALVKRGALPDVLDFAARYLVNPETAQDDLDEYVTHLLEEVPERGGGRLRQRRHFGRGMVDLYV